MSHLRQPLLGKQDSEMEHEDEDYTDNRSSEEREVGYTYSTAKASPRYTMMKILFIFGTLLLLFAFILDKAISNHDGTIDSRLYETGFKDVTNRKWGYGNPMPGGWSGAENLSLLHKIHHHFATDDPIPQATGIPEHQDHSHPIPVNHITPKPVEMMGQLVVFPDSVDLVHSQRPEQIYTGNTNVIISNQVSAIFQYPMVDHGRKYCVVQAFFPSLINLGDKSASLSGHTIIEVWNLTHHIDIDSNQDGDVFDPRPQRAGLTYSTRPARANKLGEIEARFGLLDDNRTQTPVFHCPNGYKLTVEFACKKEGCLIAFDQVKTRPLLGFEVVEDGPKN